MKNVSKALGLILTLAILAGLLMTAVPAAAGDVTFSNVTVPNVSGNQVVIGGGISAMDIAADGKTAYAYVINTTKVTAGTAVFSAFPSPLVIGANAFTTSAVGTFTVNPPAGVTATVTQGTSVIIGSPVTVLPGVTTTITVTTAGTLTITLAGTYGGTLYKSVDAGMNWTTSGIGTGLNYAFQLTQLKISPNFAADQNLVATDGTNLFRSTDAGANWYVATQTIPGALADTKISSIDISTYYNGGGVAILETFGGSTAGLDGGIGLLVTNQGNWTYWSSTSAQTGWIACDVYAAAFSPNYQTDTEIIAVVGTAAGVTVRAKMGIDAWDADVAPVMVRYAGTIVPADASNIVKLAFPSNYDSASSTNNKIFMGLYSSIAVLSGTAEIYRLKMSLSGGVSTATATAAGLGVLTDLAYNGTATAGTLVASDATSIIYSMDAVGAAVPSWNTPTTGVQGTNSRLRYGGTKLYAATKGVFSAFFTSIDVNVFSAIALMNISSASNATFKQYKNASVAGTWFANLYDSANTISARFNRILKTTDSGATWKGIFFYQNIGTEQLNNIGLTSTYATDNTIYYYTSSSGADTNGYKIYKSTDGGATWTKYSAPAGIVQIQSNSLILLDANTYWISSTGGGLYKVGSFTATDSSGAITNPINPVTPNFMVLKSTAGAIYFSSDAGNTFTKLGTGTEFANTGLNTAGFCDVANNTIYAVRSANVNNSGVGNQGTLMKWVVGTSSVWETVKAISGTSLGGYAAPFSPDQIYVVNGILYATVRGGRDAIYAATGNVTTGGMEQIWRSVNLFSDPNNLTFEAVPGSSWATMGELIRAPITIASSPAGNILTIASNDPTSTVNGFACKVQVFTDSVVTAPVPIAPANNSNTGSTVDFSWQPVTYTGAKYTVQIAYDSAFTSLVTTTPAGVALNLGPTSSTVMPQVPLIPGKTYYWRVQVAPQNPLASPWSAPVVFSSTTSISSFSPTQGGNGTVVAITGVDFNDVTYISFGGTPASSFIVASPTQIMATVGNGSTGKISVITPNFGTATSAASFTYLPAPTITGISPSSGLPSGGTAVTITGTGFTSSNTTVTLGGNAATSINVVNATSVTAVTPAGTAGPRDVVVTTPGGFATLTGGFTYLATPTITGFAPTSGGAGTSVAISGNNFTGATAVSFNGTPAASYTVNSNTSITAVVASGTASGTISVTTPGGTATSSGSFTVRLAAKLAFNTSPGGATAGTAFATQPVVLIQDAIGNTVVGDSSTQVTLTITSGTGTSGAALSGVTTVTANSGLATFSGLAINLAGSGYTLTAASPNLTSAVSSAFQVAAPSQVINANISLNSGWNLISLPLIPSDPSLTAVLSGISGKVTSVWAYDASTASVGPKYGWTNWSPTVGGDLTQMVDGKGYWINMNTAATLTISGAKLPVPPEVPPTYATVTGWNLVGFKSIMANTNGAYLTGTDYRYPIYGYVSGMYFTLLASSDNLQPGFGYWVYFNSNGMVTP